MRRLLRHVARLWRVWWVITFGLVIPALAFRSSARAAGPAHLRAACEQLGGAWIKLGQMLALRYDLMPPAYCDELLKLLNDVKPFSYTDVCSIVEAELGGRPEAVFLKIETKPFASASIGQVHRATLPTGERVAVKVQRPRIRETMRADIDLMFAVTTLLDWTRVFGATRSRDVIDEFARWTADELDYMVEARQSVLLYEHARGSEHEHIARVYRGYTTSRVLTSELMVGIPLLDIVVALRAGDTDYFEDLAEAGYDLHAIVRHLDWNMLNQVYVFGYFHADLHPANLYVLPGNAIGYVDFGMVGQLPDDVRESLTRYSWLLFQGEVESAIRELMRWLAPTADTNAMQARQQLARSHQAFLYNLGDLDTNPASRAPRKRQQLDNPYSTLAIDILEIVRRNELSLSSSIVAYLKMLMTLGTLRHQLAADYDLPDLARRFFSGLIAQQGQAWLDPRLAMGRVYGATYRVKRAIEFLEFLEAQQPLLARLLGTVASVDQQLRGLKQRLVGFGIAALLVGAALYFVLVDPVGARSVTPSPVPFEWLHLVLLGILLLVIVGLVGNLRQFFGTVPRVGGSDRR